MAPRKRAPGGGRKTMGDSAKAANFATRITPDVRAKLDALAAESGVSVSQIAGRLLQMGLAQHAHNQLDDPIRALAYLLRLLALRCQYVDTSVSNEDREWHNDPFAFDAFARSIQMLLERLRPPGEIKAPKELFPGLPTWPTSEVHAQHAFADVWRQATTFEPVSTREVRDEFAAHRARDPTTPFSLSDELAGRISSRSYAMDDIRKTFGIKFEAKRS